MGRGEGGEGGREPEGGHWGQCGMGAQMGERWEPKWGTWGSMGMGAQMGGGWDPKMGEMGVTGDGSPNGGLMGAQKWDP